MTPEQRRRACKAAARKAYRDHIGPLLGVILLIYVVNLLTNIILNQPAFVQTPNALAQDDVLTPLLPMLLSLLLAAPLQFGLYELCLRFLNGGQGKLSDVFLWFGEGKRLKAALLGQLFFSVMVFLPLLALCFVWSFCTIMLFAQMPLAIGWPLIWLSLLAVLVAVVLIALRRMFGMFTLAGSPTEPVIEASSQGMADSAPHKKELLWLILSFLPYMIPVIAVDVFVLTPELALRAPSAVLQLLSILSSVYTQFVVPYVVLSLAQFYRMVTGKAEPFEEQK